MTIPRASLLDIRFALPEDINFIEATWLKSLYFDNSWFRLIPRKVYFSVYRRVIRKILSKETTLVHVSCLKEDPSVILGYGVFENTDEGALLHYLYVKESFRRIKIATDLMAPFDIKAVTHLTDFVVKNNLKPKHISFNPFLI